MPKIDKLAQLANSISSKKANLLKEAQAKETSRALDKQWQLFSAWAKLNKLKGLPCSGTVYEAYFIYLVEKGWKLASIEQAKWAIDNWHRRYGHEILSQREEMKLFFRGISRSIGFKQHQKKDLTVEHIRQMSFTKDLKGIRDKALLLLGFAAGLRRSELSGILAEDMVFSNGAVVISLRKSKTNQVGRWEVIKIPQAQDANVCPRQALQDWLNQSQIKSGFVFRAFKRGLNLKTHKISDHHIALLIKHYVASIGLNPAEYSGHSLRAGCATYLLDKKIPLNLVAKQLRHKKLDTTLRYDRNQVSGALTGLY